MKNLLVKFEGNFKNCCSIAWKNYEEILEIVYGNFSKILRAVKLSKVYRLIKFLKNLSGIFGKILFCEIFK